MNATSKKAKVSAKTSAEPNLDKGLLRFEFTDGKSNKFWEITLGGSSHTVNYGRIGTNGQTQTKDFASEDKARASAEKLVGEKTKKGYQYVPTTGSVAKSAVPKPKATAQQARAKKSSANAKTEKNVAPAAAAEQVQPEVVLEVTSEIDLLPRDWHRATFRKRKPLPLPKETPFDPDDCKRRLTALKRIDYRLPFYKLNLNPGISAEEAHYWWLAMNGDYNLDIRQLAKSLASAKLTGKLSTKEITKVLKERTCPRESMAPLYRLMGHDAYVKLMLSNVPTNTRSYYGASDATDVMADGFVTYILPYLTDKQLAVVQKHAKTGWSSLTMPANEYQNFPKNVTLAAGAGLADKILDIVASWEDTRYGDSSSGGWTDHYQRPQDLVLGLGSSDLVASHWRRLKLQMHSPNQVRAFLACTELSALNVVAESICQESSRERAAEIVPPLALVRAPEAAEPMLYCVQNSKAPSIARDWLDKYVGNAIAGLVKTAGGRGKLAEGAVQYLRDAKRAGHLKLIKASLKGLDSGVAKRVQKEVVDYEEKVYKPFDQKSTPKWLKDGLKQADGLKATPRPDWATPNQLPTLGVGDHCLNENQVEMVLRALQATMLPDRHPLLEAIKEQIDPSQRDEFAWRLFERWQEDGTPSKQKWAMGALGHFGGDHSALKLTPLVRVWPGESQHARAVLGLECLRGMGSDTALMQLNGIAQKLKFQGLKKKAREFMEEIAQQRGMTRSELEDLIVPDLDLDERGTRTFDFGPRTFHFVLTPDLKPGIRDDGGKLRGDLPKPSAKDDEAKANQAVAAWKLLKKNLREAIKIQVPRLEQAMVTGRRWSVEQFDMLLVRHPLMINFSRMLLWGGYDAKGKLVGTFRVTEEQDYADIKDAPGTLSKFKNVGVVHPLLLAEKDAAAWGEVFSDYEIVSPFPQIGRATYTIEKGEANTKELKRFGNVKIPALSLVGALDRLGWARGIPEDAGIFHEHSKPFYGANVTAVVSYEDGIPIGYMEGWDDQKITNCIFLPGIYTPQMYPNHKKAMQIGKVEDIVLSEVIADLHVLASKGK